PSNLLPYTMGLQLHLRRPCLQNSKKSIKASKEKGTGQIITAPSGAVCFLNCTPKRHVEL
ncbi:MAG: hypothetical protein Q8O09_05215, partial [Bacillota bacterium]|nr:hypothetical protein [Bacillota bacterium]